MGDSTVQTPMYDVHNDHHSVRHRVYTAPPVLLSRNTLLVARAVHRLDIPARTICPVDCSMLLLALMLEMASLVAPPTSPIMVSIFFAVGVFCLKAFTEIL